MLALFFVAEACFGFARAAYDQGVLRTDDNSEYFRYQDIRKAFNMSKPPWFYGHNFEENVVSSEIVKGLLKLTSDCTYFKKDNITETHVNFTRHYNNEGKPQSQHLYGTFFRTHGVGKNHQPMKRTSPNGVAVSTTPDGTSKSYYKLLYSDDTDCTILRPFPFEHLPTNFPEPGTLVQHHEELEGNSYNSRIQPLCVVLLSDTRARKGGLPALCNATYKNMCGTGPKFTVVFNQSCPAIPNILGC